MGRLLFWIALVFAAFWLFRKFRRVDGPSRKAPPGLPQDMIACDQCGVHLPKSEATVGADGVFCSETHRIAYEKSRSSP